MKVTKLHCFGEQEIEVGISAEDITTALLEVPEADRPFTVTTGINNCAQFFKAVTDEMIAKLNEPQRRTIADFLTKQASRFIPPCAQ